ncbi:hypothetical protein JOL62DRAFT_278986 [Phyllosticta paracitricarpa]|uniref:Secreted protein n=1 Tax=Phyllosticta paracitricarpa TaxID=2016321 RepID=A0ABR1MW79_9PEZI
MLCFLRAALRCAAWELLHFAEALTWSESVKRQTSTYPIREHIYTPRGGSSLRPFVRRPAPGLPRRSRSASGHLSSIPPTRTRRADRTEYEECCVLLSVSICGTTGEGKGVEEEEEEEQQCVRAERDGRASEKKVGWAMMYGCGIEGP